MPEVTCKDSNDVDPFSNGPTSSIFYIRSLLREAKNALHALTRYPKMKKTLLIVFIHGFKVRLPLFRPRWPLEQAAWCTRHVRATSANDNKKDQTNKSPNLLG